MYRLLLICLALLFVTSAEAQLRFDTLSTRPIGPGMTLTHIIEHTQPWNINVVEVDLTNPHVKMRAMAAQDRVGGRETVGNMAARQEQQGNRVVAAINGDFFTTSWPVATHVQDGQMAYPPVVHSSQRPGVAFSSTNQASIEDPVFSGSVSFNDTTFTIHGVNRPRQANEIVFYNQYRGATTLTAAGGSELIVRAVTDWVVNDTVRVVVEQRRPNADNSQIPVGGGVISAYGSLGVYLNNNTAVGDTLDLFLGAMPSVGDLREMMSGGPFIVRNGQVNVGPRGDGVDRHPRTAAGINADGTRLYLVVLDGRQAASAGVTLTELAQWMVSVGIDRAMNLDGGGSSTLLIHGEVENLLLGDQRPVANGLAVFSTAPLGELASVRARQRNVRLFRGDQIQFDVDGVDEHFHPVPFDSARVQFTSDEAVGTVSSDGTLVAGDVAAEGNVYITYGSLVDTVNVVVTDIDRLQIMPGDIVIDTTRSFAFSYQAFDSDGRRRTLQAGDVAWSVIDEELGSIDDEGRFVGLRAGTTHVVAVYRAVSDTVRVDVETIYGVQSLDAFDDRDAWTLVLDNVDASGSSVEFIELEDGSQAAQFNYSFTAGSASIYRMTLRQNIVVPGVPTHVHADVKSDGRNHRVFFELEDAVGTRVTAFVPRFITETEFDSLAAPAYWAGMVHPLTVRGVGVQLASTGSAGTVNDGSLGFTKIRVSYPPPSTVSNEPGAELPVAIALEQNYPNPFNPSTTIRYAISEPGAVSLRIYDALGRLVDTLVDGARMPAGSHAATWNAESGASISSGVYFYVLESAGQRVTRSMILLK
jgi:uncharacterized protein YigE (DUF2233 family)